MAESKTETRQTELRPGKWNVDFVHSSFIVSTRHMSVADLHAKFPGLKGALQVNSEDPLKSTFELEVDTSRVTTGHPPQEDFMRSEPWLDAEHHPSVTFRSTSITPSGPSQFSIKGDLTLRGVTREVEILADFHGVVADSWGLRAGFTSTVTVDRRDFGLTWNRTFDWGVMAGWDLTIELDIELAYPDASLAQTPQ